MRRTEVLNFQNVIVKNAISTTQPLIQSKEIKADFTTVVFIRDPYTYFDYLLFDYLKNKKSILFTQDIINNMKELNNSDFLDWLASLNFIPFYNPQTFQLDISKQSQTAISNLENFDYVVPYEEIDIFLENIALGISIEKNKEAKLLFSLKAQREHRLIDTFIGKDIEIYDRALDLWELVKKNDFKPLGSLIQSKKQENQKVIVQKPNKYKGVAGQITSDSISGWVCHELKTESVAIAIYINHTLLCIVKADKMREDLRKQQIHPTGICGFEAIFDQETFKKGDNIEIKILPGKVLLPLGENIKSFLAQ